jgi:hypothetical protein
MYALLCLWSALAPSVYRPECQFSLSRARCRGAAALPACLGSRALRRPAADRTCFLAPGHVPRPWAPSGPDRAIPAVPSGSTVPTLAVPCYAAPGGTIGLRHLGESGLDAAGPRRQTSPPFPVASARAGKRGVPIVALETATQELRRPARTPRLWHTTARRRLP